MRRSHTPSILAALTILALLCTAVLGAPTQEARLLSGQHHAVAASSSDGGGNEGGNRTVERYLLDPNGLADAAARTGTLTVTAMEGEQLSLLLTEFDMMVKKSYIDRDANGTLRHKPFLGRTFNGNLATDPGSRAFLLISPNGLYGSVTSQGKVWSFQPMREQPPSADGSVVQEVSTYRPPEEATSDPMASRTSLLAGGNARIVAADVEAIPSTQDLSTTTSASTTAVQLFQDCNFGGWRADFGEGTFNLADIEARGGSNDAASAVKIGAGFAATLYEHDEQGGRSIELPGGDHACLVVYDFNDILSSLTVEQLDSSSSSTPSSYAFCAHEGEWCAFSGRTMDVAYGADGSYFTRYEVSGGINCDNNNFGDPLPYTYKACYIKESASSQANREANDNKRTTNPNPEGTPAAYDPSPQTEAPAGYVFCADEDGYCGGFSGAKTIAYGAKGHFSYKTGVTGGIGCTNANFGDPNPYERKACYTYENVSPDGGPNGYLFCTTEGSFCSFSGTRDVAYGANGAYYYQQGVTDGISCTNSVFGDPNYGVYKACYTYDGAAGSAPCGSPSHAGYCGLYIKPFADLDYVQYASDWYDRIVASYGHGVQMWQDETNIQLWLYEPENILTNFEAVPNEGCGYNDGGLANFGAYIAAFDFRFVGPNAYALFEAHTDMGTDGVSSSGVGGCGATASLNSHDGEIQKPDAHHVLNAKQWHHQDSWYPDEPSLLGIAVNHELTHNAGEGGHPGDGGCYSPSDWTYNIMANKVWFNCTSYWRTHETQRIVELFSYQFLE